MEDLWAAEQQVKDDWCDDTVEDLVRHLPAHHVDLITELDHLVPQVYSCIIDTVLQERALRMGVGGGEGGDGGEVEDCPPMINGQQGTAISLLHLFVYIYCTVFVHCFILYSIG